MKFDKDGAIGFMIGYFILSKVLLGILYALGSWNILFLTISLVGVIFELSMIIIWGYLIGSWT